MMMMMIVVIMLIKLGWPPWQLQQGQRWRWGVLGCLQQSTPRARSGSPRWSPGWSVMHCKKTYRSRHALECYSIKDTQLCPFEVNLFQDDLKNLWQKWNKDWAPRASAACRTPSGLPQCQSGSSWIGPQWSLAKDILGIHRKGGIARGSFFHCPQSSESSIIIGIKIRLTWRWVVCSLWWLPISFLTLCCPPSTSW